MSAITDRARDFWDRISPRERRIVVLAAILAPLTIALWLSFNIHDGLVAREQNNDKMRRALLAVEDLHARGAPVQQADDVIATMGTEPLSLETYLDKAAQKAGTQLKGDVTPHPSQTRNGFVTNTVSCQLSDVTIEQLKSFLQQVESDSKVVMVTQMELRRDFRDKAKLDATLEVSTYSREPPAKSDGSAGGGSADGSSSAGSAKKGG
jgi:type II secretory pathway component PulM